MYLYYLQDRYFLYLYYLQDRCFMYLYCLIVYMVSDTECPGVGWFCSVLTDMFEVLWNMGSFPGIPPWYRMPRCQVFCRNWLFCSFWKMWNTGGSPCYPPFLRFISVCLTPERCQADMFERPRLFVSNSLILCSGFFPFFDAGALRRPCGIRAVFHSLPRRAPCLGNCPPPPSPRSPSRDQVGGGVSAAAAPLLLSSLSVPLSVSRARRGRTVLIDRSVPHNLGPIRTPEAVVSRDFASGVRISSGSPHTAGCPSQRCRSQEPAAVSPCFQPLDGSTSFQIYIYINIYIFHSNESISNK